MFYVRKPGQKITKDFRHIHVHKAQIVVLNFITENDGANNLRCSLEKQKRFHAY